MTHLFLYNSTAQAIASTQADYCERFWDLRMSRAQTSQKMKKLLKVTLSMQGVWFFILAVNSDSDTHPNIFLGIILLQNSCQNVHVYDSNGSKDRTIIVSGTTNKKGVIIFNNFTADRDFGTYHILFIRFKLP